MSIFRSANDQGATQAHNQPRRTIWLVGCGVLALASSPFWTDGYTVTTLRAVLLFGLFALSLDFLRGKPGLASFGHAAFFGLGAYGLALTPTNLGTNPQTARSSEER